MPRKNKKDLHNNLNELSPIEIHKHDKPFEIQDEGLTVKVLDKNTLKQYKLANDKPRKKDGLEKEKNTEGNIVEVSDVKKTYLSGNVATDVLKGISFSIKKGEIAILYGKSGSGKSTLLNIISALDRPTSGKVIVNDVNLPYLSNSKQTLFRRNNISFIFQNYNLLQNLNSYDNVETGAYLQKDKAKHLDIKKLFKDFDLEQCMFKYPSQMSGGQQQRVSILRAIAKNADILVADEPTGALDEKTGQIVLKILQEINRDYGTTIIIVSHDPDVAQMADKVIYLELGHIKDIILQDRKWLIEKNKKEM
ncbi:ABC transporter ATP-binding protein [Mycoplasmopsis arginini]|uniref:ABC transporter ATP-binding protein n=1 Tax=Mycoplasmopsis arginini TaxID=2094 RepID=A0AA43QW35_MYCAR|nr:ABC transporter ATP-binding protein [Mycoplasmopsis arginini]MCY2902917.1 ABC transporter ATP-binding protein [Mycoplasmopsis arginini QMP CG1-2758]MDI3349258.1 ABC transporter ATP-binding protein [Mycoplasmopsis arginini]MDI3350450.1 ABC transporter ATP-binding protein [Mycoplasmopsis arginini]MDI3350836.1 ABC transporter ATP-binding protein [Mycoplasmopsis arginini]MDI3352607.1 ABC transporter ATP-binding protein [Mycoplasmopsis arginini]